MQQLALKRKQKAKAGPGAPPRPTAAPGSSAAKAYVIVSRSALSSSGAVDRHAMAKAARGQSPR